MAEKNTDDDNNCCHDNFDQNFGNFDEGKVKKKKHKKKLTNVTLYVCMSVENSKMLVFVCFFKFFPIVAWEKKT